MSVYHPTQVYKQSSVETASPGDLTLMLYKGCIKFIKLAKQALEENNMSEKNKNIIKAQNIMNELIVTLNKDIEISASLAQLYDYMVRQLIEANLKNDLAILDEVQGYAEQFRDMWIEVIRKNRQIQYG